LTGGDYFCGGFIINENWIGSAARCTFVRFPTEVLAIVGTNSLISGGVSHSVEKIINHESFIPDLYLNDVSLLKTRSTIMFTSNVAPISLASIYVQPGMETQTAGWGKTFHLEEEFSDDLQFIRLQTITNADCRARLEAGGRRDDLIFDSSLCTFNAIGQGS
jgi:trypsin